MVTITRKKEDALFRAIADPTRREILKLLRDGPRTVGDIASNFRTSRPAISKHLRLLRAAGLVVSHKNGTASICGLNARPLQAVNDWLQDYRALWGESMRSLKTYIEAGTPSSRGIHLRPAKPDYGGQAADSAGV